MQLLLLLMLALAGGNSDALKEVKPMLESLGGGEALEAIQKAEEISAMVNAVQSIASMAGNGSPHHNGVGNPESGDFAQHGFPLAPVSRIADENITYCLSRYISLGE